MNIEVEKKRFRRVRYISVIKEFFIGLLWMTLFIYGYNILFLPLFNFDYFQSIGTLWIMGVLTLIVRISVFKDATFIQKVMFYILPFGIYTALSYFDTYHSFLIVIGIIIAMLEFCYIAVIVSKLLGVNDKEKRIYILKKHITKYFTAIILIISLGCTIITGTLLVKEILGLPMAYSDTEAIEEDEEEKLLTKNISSIEILYDKTYDGLNTKSRLNIFQDILNIEVAHLGISHKVFLCEEAFSPNMLGRYDENKQRISINSRLLKGGNAEQTLNVICHEAYHAYQRDIVKLYNTIDDKEQRKLLLFNEAKEYKQNFNEYYSGEVNFARYVNQVVEVDSREYAKDRVEYYKNYIKDSTSHMKKGIAQ